MEPKIRVLLVDDEERFVQNLARILRGRGFDVATALDGFQAVDAIKGADAMDVVLLDVKMPVMDGVATLKEIKQLAPDVQVIMLTGHATLSSGTQAMRNGAYDYLMKPCDIEDLIEKIREAHEARRIRRHPVLWPRKMIRDVPLHPFKKLLPDDPLVKALEMMRRASGEETLEAVYVVDSQERLRGVVGKRDLINEAQQAQPARSVTWAELLRNPQWLPEKRLGHVMRPDPITTQPNGYLTDAANQMIMHHVRCLPVLRAGKPARREAACPVWFICPC